MVTAVPPRECDLIMKGGITSGVVYPRAAAHLAATYRFRNVGGASAGAIAAAFVAAAECGRSSGSFERLHKLPTDLGRDLKTLFQPSPGTAPLHRMLMAFVEPGATVPAKVRAAVRAVWALARWPFIVTAVAVMIPGVLLAALFQAAASGPLDWVAVWLSLLLWLPVAVVAGAVVATYKAVRSAERRLGDNGFGLCNGHSTPGPAPLTDWMHRQINQLAGMPADGPPLTFGQLWGAQGVADFDEIVGSEGELALKPVERARIRRNRNVDLVVMTTNLTQRRPHRFPFETRVFYWCETCFGAYFPADVVAQMRATDGDGDDPPAERVVHVGGVDRTIPMTCRLHPATTVRHFPRPPDVPVVVAARLSLSFPGLISAVPIHFIDHAREPESVELVIAWFSDGGIASNFPMHLFDDAFPTRPTFGFDLQPRTIEHGDAEAIIPRRAGGGRSHAIGDVVGFGKAILDTMQNWSDSTQLAMSTFSDRVPEIRLTDSEGGINLAMPAPVIEAIADRGATAAALLDGFDLAAHQDARAKMALRVLDALLESLEHSCATGFQPTIDALNPTRRTAAGEVLALAGEWSASHPLSSGDSPRLQADLRVAPRQ
jgi:predicted acylesterase/phospholipase RssA